MKRMVLGAFVSLVLAGPAMAGPVMAAPGDMNVATFLAKADALRARGAMALFSADFKLLKGEGMAAGEAYRTRLGAERAAGKPSSCPPKGAKLSSDKLLGHLRSYPEPSRARTSMKQAMADYFIRTYPCS